jgi:hypothetical protein
MTTVDQPPVPGYLTGDYDNDDYTGEHFGDGDNDDSTRRKDRDNDFDNSSGSYYDSDDAEARDFGHAADLTDRLAVTSLVRRYYAAAASADGATACSLLAPALSSSVAEDLGRSPPGPSFARGSTCAVVMSKIFKEFARQLRAFAARLQVTSVRVQGERGVAVLGFGSLPGRQLRVRREGDTWTVAALLDSELP